MTCNIIVNGLQFGFKGLAHSAWPISNSGHYPMSSLWSSQGTQHCSQLLRVCRLRQLLRFSPFLKPSISIREKTTATIALRQLLRRVSALRQLLQLLRVLRKKNKLKTAGLPI